MRILFLSDIHGVPSALEAALAKSEALGGFDRLVLLGDLLYHGPRNGVPNFYDPIRVVEILSPLASKIVAVRGNCDAEVDQALLPFPIGATFDVLEADGEKFFLSHGHLYGHENFPPENIAWTVLAQGHTHIPRLERLADGRTLLNPGSVSLPKGGSTRSCAYWNGKELTLVNL